MIYYSRYSPGLLVAVPYRTAYFVAADHYFTGAAIESPATLFTARRDQLHSLRSCNDFANAKGPTEIRQVNMAFNRLFTTLNQAQKERTIMLAGISHAICVRH